MNCEQANQIKIRTVLESFSLFPSKDNNKTAFYFAIDREERTPSLSVDFLKNTAFDFGTGKKYDNVALVQGIKKCTVSAALEYLSQFSMNTNHNNSSIPPEKHLKSYENSHKILVIKEVQHPALLNYLRVRKVED